MPLFNSSVKKETIEFYSTSSRTLHSNLYKQKLIKQLARLMVTCNALSCQFFCQLSGWRYLQFLSVGDVGEQNDPAAVDQPTSGSGLFNDELLLGRRLGERQHRAVQRVLDVEVFPARRLPSADNRKEVRKRCPSQWPTSMKVEKHS